MIVLLNQKGAGKEMKKFLKITGISLLTIGLAACSVTKESANEQTEQSSDPTIQVLASFILCMILLAMWWEMKAMSNC